MVDIFKSDSNIDIKGVKNNESVSTIQTPESHVSGKKVTDVEKLKSGLGVLKYPQNEEEKKALPGYTKNPISSFTYFPDKVNFLNKDPQEKVVLLLRKHPITNLSWVVLTFFLCLIPGFISVIAAFEGLPKDYQLTITIVWYLLLFAFAFEKFLVWFFSVNIVTDERVFDVDFSSLVFREMTDAEIDQIQDVTVQVGGGIRTLFNYGDVLVQTASEVPRIVFDSVPEPDRVARILRELRIEEEVEELEGRIR